MVDWYRDPHSRCVGAKALDTPYGWARRRLGWLVRIDGRSVTQAALSVCRRESAGHTLRLNTPAVGVACSNRRSIGNAGRTVGVSARKRWTHPTTEHAGGWGGLFES